MRDKNTQSLARVICVGQLIFNCQIFMIFSYLIRLSNVWLSFLMFDSPIAAMLIQAGDHSYGQSRNCVTFTYYSYARQGKVRINQKRFTTAAINCEKTVKSIMCIYLGWLLLSLKTNLPNSWTGIILEEKEEIFWDRPVWKIQTIREILWLILW